MDNKINIKQISYSVFKNYKFENISIQRRVDEQHVNELIKNQTEFKSKYGYYIIPPIIIAVLFEDSIKKLYLVDGQHRTVLLERINDDSLTFYIQEVYIQSEEELNTIWIFLNKSKPVELFDSNSITIEFFNNVEKEMLKHYKPFIKYGTSKPHRPNISMEVFKKEISEETGLLELITNKTLNPKNFIELIDKFNNLICEILESQNKNFMEQTLIDDMKKVQSKVKKGDFKPLFWRLFSNPSTCLLLLLKNSNMDEIIKIDRRYKRTFSKKLRMDTWKKEAGDNNKSECKLCKKILIRDESWHMSHIISVYNGGSDELDNLTILCAPCNLEMGRNDMVLI
jgi:hypothetical protein